MQRFGLIRGSKQEPKGESAGADYKIGYGLNWQKLRECEARMKQFLGDRLEIPKHREQLYKEQLVAFRAMPVEKLVELLNNSREVNWDAKLYVFLALTQALREKDKTTEL